MPLLWDVGGARATLRERVEGLGRCLLQFVNFVVVVIVALYYSTHMSDISKHTKWAMEGEALPTDEV
jgi:hypothetical protein